MPKVDTVEVYAVRKVLKRRQPPTILGWRFRFFKAGHDEAMLVSNGLYDTREDAARVAGLFNADAYKGEFKLKLAR